MKANQVKPVQEKEQALPCIQCGKPTNTWYGRWGNSGTCSRPCEEHYAMRQRSIFSIGEEDDEV